MQHILLTGATGFLGSHLLEALLKQGYKVTILKRSTSDTWRIKQLLEQVSTFDVDQVAIEEAFKADKVDVVIHTACSYGRNGQSLHEVAETNLMFGLKVLDAALRNSVSTFINTETFFNTNAVFSNYLSSYSLSKKQFSEWLKQSVSSIKVISLNLQHVYGPKDDVSKFIPWLVHQLENGVESISLTPGNQIRDFVYVDDVVSAYMLMLSNAELLPRYSEFDVGTGELITVREFVETIYQAFQQKKHGNHTRLGFGEIPMRDGELLTVEVDNQALKKLGWTCRFTKEQGIKVLLGE